MELTHSAANTMLAKARAFACLSAVNAPLKTFDDMKLANSVCNLLNQRIYWEDEPNPQHIRPYLPGVRPDGTQVLFIPSWARAGVRYLKPSVNLATLDPTDWYARWWEIYVQMVPSDSVNGDHSVQDLTFHEYHEMLGKDEEFIRVKIATGLLAAERSQTRKVREIPQWQW